jgi:hypothetical protein
VGDPVSWLQIEQGWNVVTSDGLLVGTVAQTEKLYAGGPSFPSLRKFVEAGVNERLRLVIGDLAPVLSLVVCPLKEPKVDQPPEQRETADRAEEVCANPRS